MSKAQGKFDFSVHHPFDKNQKFQYWDFKVPSVRHTHTHTHWDGQRKTEQEISVSNVHIVI